MTFGQMKTLFRRHVKDVNAAQWSDVEVGAILNLAYADVQTRIIQWNREAHIFWDYINLTAGTSWYPLLESFTVISVGTKAAASDTVYSKLTKYDYERIKDAVSSGGYAKKGQWIGIFPPPAISITSGIELQHVPIMQLSEDSDTPRVKLPLHLATVYRADEIALGETDDDGRVYGAKYEKIMDNLGGWYDVESDGGERFSVDGA